MSIFKRSVLVFSKFFLLSSLFFFPLTDIRAEILTTPVVTVIGSAVSAPFLLDIEGKEKHANGLTKDYVKALLKKLNLEVEILVLPKFRINEYARRGKIDLNCYTNQKWAGQEIGEVLWSNPIFTVKDMLISRDHAVKSVADAHGKTVGVVFSYKYPGDFDKAVEANLIKRGQSPNERAILMMLLASRYDYAIVPHIQLDYFLKEQPKAKINKNGFVLSENEIRCWVKKSGPINIEKLNKAIDDLKANGELKKIFNKYR